MIVDIDWLTTAKRRIAEINAVPLDSINWVKEGKDVQFSKKELEAFKNLNVKNDVIIDVYQCTPKGI